MEIEHVEYSPLADGSVLASVEIVPTQDGGIFVSSPFDGVRAVGNRALIHGITDMDHLKQIKAGNKDVLGRYVQLDVEMPGSFKFADCHVFIETSYSSYHSAGQSIQEFAPIVAEVEAAA